MCKCTPEMRTPFCGKPGCEWPTRTRQPATQLANESGSAPLLSDKDLEWIADIIFIAKRDDEDIYDTARKIVAYLAGGL